MPESKRRKAAVEKRKYQREREMKAERTPATSPSWWAPVMVGLMILGLIIVVTAYVSHGSLPIPFPNPNYNLFLGFGVMICGFLMTMGWK
ncbi:MAG: cell division protein CrgA [Flaviflexus sp.]|nr:cell division protein CrgA [Flaviflexus sp.]